MRALILISLLLLVGCKTRRHSVSNHSLSIDSTAISTERRTIDTADSLVRHLDFSFDTLKITIERPAVRADLAERMSLTAIKGRMAGSRRAAHGVTERINRTDTSAYHLAASGAETASRETVRVSDPPPAGTVIAILALAAAGAIVVMLRRKK